MRNTRSAAPALLILVTSALFFSACSSEKAEPVSATPGTDALSGGPEVAMNAILENLSEHRAEVLWEALPASYQTDINEVVKLAGDKIDGEIYDGVSTLVGRAFNVLDDKRDFLFETELGNRPPEEEVEKLREGWPALSGLINTVVTSSLGSSEGLRSFDGAKFFAESVPSMLKGIDALGQIQRNEMDFSFTELKDAAVQLLSHDGDQAELQITLPSGKLETAIFSRVDERWVPQVLSAEWTERFSGIRTGLEGIDLEKVARQKDQLMSILGMIDGVVTQISNAETQEQFDQALQGAMMPLMGMFIMGQGLGGGGGLPPMPSGPPPIPMPSGPPPIPVPSGPPPMALPSAP